MIQPERCWVCGDFTSGMGNPPCIDCDSKYFYSRNDDEIEARYEIIRKVTRLYLASDYVNCMTFKEFGIKLGILK